MNTLFVSPTSPYARKARIVVREKSLHSQVEEVMVNPFDEPEALLAQSPLSKVPVLARQDGVTLTESALICAYLDSLSTDLPLLPSGADKWDGLAFMALADGVIDCAIPVALFRKREDAPEDKVLMDKRLNQMRRGLAEMNKRAGQLSHEQISLVEIGALCTAEYMDLRFADLAWRDLAPALSAWHEKVKNRASFTETAPPAV